MSPVSTTSEPAAGEVRDGNENKNENEDSKDTMSQSCSQPEGEEKATERGKQAIEVGDAGISVGGVIVSDKLPAKEGGSQ